MPLEKGPGKAKFKHNVEVEMASGKPQKQSLAIAFSEAKQIKSKTPKHSAKPIKKSGRGR